MTKFLVGKKTDLEDGKMLNVTAAGTEILVANIGGNFYAIGNICNHAGASLHEGELNGKDLKCPWHGAKWDVTNGNLIQFPQALKPLESYTVTVDNDTLYVEV